jgi:hypothetical protein
MDASTPQPFKAWDRIYEAYMTGRELSKQKETPWTATEQPHKKANTVNSCYELFLGVCLGASVSIFVT